MNRSNQDLFGQGDISPVEETRPVIEATDSLIRDILPQGARLRHDVRKTTAKETTEPPAATKAVPTNETDFYRNPTLLSRLVLNQKYEQAISRLDREPGEAATWVCAKRKIKWTKKKKARQSSVGRYSFRQLPLHTACINLARAQDAQVRRTLNELIQKLIVTYPAACDQVDHKGRLPLQEAIRNGVDSATISIFLTANPKLVDLKDASGRTPSQVDLNRYSEEEAKEIVELLNRDQSFWELASKEVVAQSQLSQMATVISQDEKEEIRVGGSDDVDAIAWEQLEERAIAAEQILAETNEENYLLTKRIEVLSKKWFDLLDENEKDESSHVAKEVTRLQQENKALNDKLYKMELLVRESTAAPDDEGSEGRKRARSDVALDVLSTMTDLAQVTPREKELLRRNKHLQDEYDSLTEAYQGQRKRVHHLERLVQLFRRRFSPRETVASGVSTLTDNDERSSSTRSSFLAEIEREIDERLKQTSAPVEIAWSPASGGFQKYALARPAGNDDLSDLFRSAAKAELESSTSGTQSSRKAKSPLSSLSSKSSTRMQIDLEIPALIPPESTGFDRDRDRVADVGRDRLGFVEEEKEEEEAKEEIRELELPALYDESSLELERSL